MGGWRDDEIETLRQLWAHGYSGAECARHMAQRFGRRFTRNSIIGKAARLNLPQRATTVRKPSMTSKKKPKHVTLAAAAMPESPFPPPRLPASHILPAEPRPDGLITIETLRPGMCKYPIGDPGDADFHFCGKQVQPKRPWAYCAEHAALCYQPPASRGPRTKIKQANFNDWRLPPKP